MIFFSLLDPVNNSVGYSVSIAEDGSKALKCLEREDFDAVIISIEQLPPGSNPDLIKLFQLVILTAIWVGDYCTCYFPRTSWRMCWDQEISQAGFTANLNSLLFYQAILKKY